MHPHEEATIRAFIVSSKRDRWLQKLASPKHRQTFLDVLNHCRDIDERNVMPLRSGADAVQELRSRGAPSICHVIADLTAIDGQDLLLTEAIEQAELGGFGAIICCVPGQLAYYIDEAGSKRRLLLELNDA